MTSRLPPSPTTTLFEKSNPYREYLPSKESLFMHAIKYLPIIKTLYQLIPKTQDNDVINHIFRVNLHTDISRLLLSYLTSSEISALYRTNKACRESCKPFIYYIVYGDDIGTTHINRFLAVFEEYRPGDMLPHVWSLVPRKEVEEATEIDFVVLVVASCTEMIDAPILKLKEMISSCSQDVASIIKELPQLPGLKAIVSFGQVQCGRLLATLQLISIIPRNPLNPDEWLLPSDKDYTIATPIMTQSELEERLKEFKGQQSNNTTPLNL
jgi:hypothetical protein